jgi:hypothetical protein
MLCTTRGVLNCARILLYIDTVAQPGGVHGHNTSYRTALNNLPSILFIKNIILTK